MSGPAGRLKPKRALGPARLLLANVVDQTGVQDHRTERLKHSSNRVGPRRGFAPGAIPRLPPHFCEVVFPSIALMALPASRATDRFESLSTARSSGKHSFVPTSARILHASSRTKRSASLRSGIRVLSVPQIFSAL